MIYFLIILFAVIISQFILIRPIKKIKFYTNPIPNIKTRDDIAVILDHEKFESGIEIGVQAGYYTDALISKWKSCKLFIMVDPWLQQKFYDDAANVDNDKQKKLFQNSIDVVKKHSNEVEFIILKTTSEKAVIYLKNQQYDFIYLDGRHDYNSVKKDILMYYPLVKPGGILAGHDYQDENRNEWRMDENGNINQEKKAAKAAVDEFTTQNKLIVYKTHEGNYESWMIRKPTIIQN